MHTNTTIHCTYVYSHIVSYYCVETSQQIERNQSAHNITTPQHNVFWWNTKWCYRCMRSLCWKLNEMIVHVFDKHARVARHLTGWLACLLEHALKQSDMQVKMANTSIATVCNRMQLGTTEFIVLPADIICGSTVVDSIQRALSMHSVASSSHPKPEARV